MNAHSPVRQPFLHRDALIGLTLAPPLITILVAQFGSTAPSIGNATGCLLATWVCTVVVGALVHVVVEWVAPRLLAALPSRVAATAAVVAIAALTVVIGIHAVLPRLFWLPPGTRSELTPSVLRALAVASVYLAVARVAAIVAERSRDQADRTRLSEEQALRAQVAALQAQMSPHFLFNTLNAVASLIPERPDLAEATIERLAGVLQYSLSCGKRSVVPLGEELATVRDYLGIEQARFGSRLRASIEVSPDLHDQQVPPMLLQPLVENAVLHGLASRESGGEVRITGRTEQHSLVLTVSDDGVGPGGSRRRGTRVGLNSVRERLALTYGASATVDVRARVGGGFECELRVPRG